MAGRRDDFRTWFLHYHFRSKADLARAVWLRIASSFVPGILQMMASDLSLDEKIDQFVDAYHRRLTRHPYLSPYVISEAARHPDLVDNFYSPERREAARRMIDKLREQIDDVVKARRIAPVSAEQFFITQFVIKPKERMNVNLEYSQGIEDNRGVYLKLGYAW